MTRHRLRAPSGQQGAAIVLAIMLSLAVSGVAAAVWVSSRTEGLMAGNFGRAREALHVAEGGIALAIRDLAAAPNWTDVLAGAATSTFTDGSPVGPRRLSTGDMVVPCCGAGSLTDAVQQRARDGRSWGADTPVWRLYAWGPAGGWLPPGQVESAVYAFVWVADDVLDGDGDPGADNNGIVELHAHALGVGGTRRIVETTVERQRLEGSGAPGPGVRVLSWREVRW